MRQFGELPAGSFRERPGAYGILVDPDFRVAVVVVGENGAAGTHLPGGGIEAGESPLDALHREVGEETGYSIEVLHELGCAAQIVHVRGQIWNKIGHFYVCRPLSVVRTPEPDHQLHWWGPIRAKAALAHPFYRFMVQRALGPC